MNDDKIPSLENRIAKLEANIIDLHKLFAKESTSVTDHLEFLYEHLRPLFHKAFPAYARTIKQFENIFKPTRHPPPTKNDEST